MLSIEIFQPSRGETPGPQSSITKIVSGNKLQEIANFGLDMLDSAGILRTDEEGAEQSMYQYGFYGAAGIRIAGGTDEILKNIISEQVLGMPQDMRADKGLPFNEIPCLLYTSPSPRDGLLSRMPSSA